MVRAKALLCLQGCVHLRLHMRNKVVMLHRPTWGTYLTMTLTCRAKMGVTSWGECSNSIVQQAGACQDVVWTRRKGCSEYWW